ncbi:hypothetical protein [Amycolatopsis sp. SID8362]|uniref:hypothetical protein n=1 Tax=Amycolatopsis sp. SID8362 TaxID=2690346 RepID=UPI001367C6EC|nr:hypothetical protein [Amycolatopsis sp. SID8362]NBH03469.1 hypothetical protein [Amycolatopsis sp. SID8362]NED40169.1 hypothetical protein [Amycolatopsis sp. SID8362]
MTAAVRRFRAARGGLARLVVVVALLVGFALSGGPVCPLGGDMPMAMGESAAAAMVHRDDRHPAAHDVAVADEVAPVPQRDGGVIATCLMLLVAVVATVTAVAARRGFRLPIQASRLTEVVPRLAGPRPPSLAELCLLRT